MPHPLPLSAHVHARFDDCVHCGLCLATCPTYAELGDENDSPRGRIVLMKGLAGGQLAASPGVVTHLDRCLDCRACETACPSGVQYGLLIESVRVALVQAEEGAKPSTWSRRLVDLFLYELLPYRDRLIPMTALARWMQRLGIEDWVLHSRLFARLPADVQKMLATLPPLEARPEPLPAVSPAIGPRRGRVAFLLGCAGEALQPMTHRNTVRVLNLNGVDVLVPTEQGCCGAIHYHGGRTAGAVALVKQNIACFEQALAPQAEGGGGADALVNNMAGCGAMLKSYAEVLHDDPAWRDRAERVVARTMDVHVYLAKLGLSATPGRLDETVCYHEACHLVHAQKVTREPRALLKAVPGLRVADLFESNWCCGAAGSYNLTQPELSAQLARRKLANIAASGASTVVSGNIGCQLQLLSYAKAAGQRLRVVHTFDLLAAAYAAAQA